MTLGQLDNVHKFVWMYIIKYDARHPGKVMRKIPLEARSVKVEYIYPTLTTLYEESAAATVKPCLAVIVNAKQWQKAVGNA